MPKDARIRLQIDLPPRHQVLLGRLRSRLGGSEAEAARKAMELIDNVTVSIEQGYKLVAVPMDDEHPDAMPELTKAMRPELGYTYLVARPHPWRRQLFVKGRRLTAGQVAAAMRENAWESDRTAEEYDLPVDAVLEALDYSERFADLIAAENAEDARVAEAAT